MSKVIDGIDTSRRVGWAKFYSTKSASLEVLQRLVASLRWCNQWDALHSMRLTLEHHVKARGSRLMDVHDAAFYDYVFESLGHLVEIFGQSWDQKPPESIRQWDECFWVACEEARDAGFNYVDMIELAHLEATERFGPRPEPFASKEWAL